ncbi:uncharacterized protein [Heptranchias perlo]|uniref:uncharacterized protein n=1 Tax=Heptranchias perlo TaxID=212740 RepID=UPI00355964AD
MEGLGILGLLLVVICSAQPPSLLFPADKCWLSPKNRKDCGFPGIEASECVQRGCCFDAGSRDAPPCFYSLDSLPVCTKDGQVLIAISKDLTLPPVNLTTVHLKEGDGAECSPTVASADTVLFQFAVTECGATQRVYFHCSAEVCYPSTRENCTAPCSPKRRRSVDNRSGALVTADGPILFLEGEERLAARIHQDEKDAAVDSTSLVPGLAVGVALLSVALLVGTVALWKMEQGRRVGSECSSMEL